MGREKISPKHKAAALKHHVAGQHQAERKKGVSSCERLPHAVEHMVNEAKEKHKEAATEHRAGEHAKGKANHREVVNVKHQAQGALHDVRKPAKDQHELYNMNGLLQHDAAASPQEGSPAKFQRFAMCSAGDISSCVAVITSTVTLRPRL
jgi:hypothetical protein